LIVVFSDEDTSVEALVTRWLQSRDEDDRDVLGGWIKDYFYDALKWILEQVLKLCDDDYSNGQASTCLYIKSKQTCILVGIIIPNGT